MYPLLYILYSLIFNLLSYCLCWWLGLRFWCINEVTVDQCCSWLGSSSLKAYWVGKVFAYFSNYLIDVWYHLKVVVSEFTVGITYTVMGEKLPKINFKMAFFVFQFKNPVHVRPLRCNKHLEQRKCKHNLSLCFFFLEEKVCFQWHTWHTKNIENFKTFRVKNAVHPNIVLIILQQINNKEKENNFNQQSLNLGLWLLPNKLKFHIQKKKKVWTFF